MFEIGFIMDRQEIGYARPVAINNICHIRPSDAVRLLSARN